MLHVVSNERIKKPSTSPTSPKAENQLGDVPAAGLLRCCWCFSSSWFKSKDLRVVNFLQFGRTNDTKSNHVKHATAKRRSILFLAPESGKSLGQASKDVDFAMTFLASPAFFSWALQDSSADSPGSALSPSNAVLEELLDAPWLGLWNPSPTAEVPPVAELWLSWTIASRRQRNPKEQKSTKKRSRIILLLGTA